MPTLVVLALTAAVAIQAPATAAAAGQAGAGNAAYYFLLGRHLEGEGKVADAVAALKKAIDLAPASGEPRAELAALYLRQEKAGEAVDAAEDALKVSPKNQEANRVLGTALAAQRQPAHPGDDVSKYPARAMAALAIARGDGAGDLNIDLTLARLYLDADRYADAVPLMRRIVLEQPQYAEGWLLLAEAQEGAGRGDAAVDTLTQLLEDQPQFFRGRVQLAETLDRQHKYADAAEQWAAAQALNPRSTEIAARRGSALINAGRAGDARDVLAAALKQAPGDLRLTFMLAQAQRDAGDLEEAETTARALHQAHPDDVRFTFLLSQMLESRGQYQQIVDFLGPEIAKLRAANAKGGQIATLLGSQGLALQQLRKYDAAIAAFKEAVTLAPDDPVRQVLLIQGYSAAGRHKDAIDARAKAQFPEDSTIVYQLGAALDRAGRREEAEKTFRGLIEADPLDAGALNYLGYMLVERGPSSRLDEAVELIQRALKVDPDNPSFLDSLGWAYVQQGKLDLADAPLTTAAGKLPTNSVIQDHLGDLREKQKRSADAIAAWQKALAGDGDSIDRGKIQKKIDSAKKSK